MLRRRSTASITLVLIGSAALYGCGEEVGQRDLYRTEAECKQDWGTEPARCERVTSGNHTGYYYGPYYRGSGVRHLAPGTTMQPRQGSHSIGSTSVTKSSAGSSSVARGGFGSSASAHASSSSSS